MSSDYLPASQNSGLEAQCPLCGARFDPSSLICHTSCPMSAGCHILCCPHCGYQMPDETRMTLTAALRRLWETRPKPSALKVTQP